MSVQPIEILKNNEGGGKANGLSFLKNNGFSIPQTWIIHDQKSPEIELLLNNLPQNKSFAIRSSASVEDGLEHSFAGQFETFLDVKGKTELHQAIDKCFLSASSANVVSYKKEFDFEKGNGMHVIVQEMVKSQLSGVLFTIDPISNRQDRMILSLTKGLGENLMSGKEGGESHSFFKHQRSLPKSKLLTGDQFRSIAKEAKRIEEKYGMPADLEWAIDEEGKLWWLQIRPVTTATDVHFNELDHQPRFENPIYPRANIGEMMPGPVTPLTLSVFAKSIDVGLHDFYHKSGALNGATDEYIFIHSFYNHLFFDLQALYNIGRTTFLAKKKNIDMSVVGEIVQGVEVKTEVGLLKGIINSIGMIRYVNRAPKAATELKELAAKFRMECPDDINDCYQLITKNLPINHQAYSLHYNTSSQSGSFYSLLLNLFSKGKIPSMRDQEKVAALFTDIPDVESAHVVKSIDELALLLSKQEKIKYNFLNVKADQAHVYLKKGSSEEIKIKWKEFINRHRHRCVREAELREKEWALDPLSVIEGLRSKTTMFLEGDAINNSQKEAKQEKDDLSGLNTIARMIAKKVLPKARKAVAVREQTKAWSIRVQHEFKLAYRHLAKLLVNKQWLSDEDQIFFLTNSEIGKLITADDKSVWKDKAEKRRHIFPGLKGLSFPDISFGIPIPDEKSLNGSNIALKGIPVSRGIVKGRVRIVHSIDDARKLKQGEIMVSRYTDIGWTPFYSTISGLVTEIGSPLSHGAVVAREYKLPAIVSAKGAMDSLETGQMIRIDAIEGRISIVE